MEIPTWHLCSPFKTLTLTVQSLENTDDLTITVFTWGREGYTYLVVPAPSTPTDFLPLSPFLVTDIVNIIFVNLDRERKQYEGC